MAGRAVFFLVLFLFPTLAAAQDLRVFLVTIGPGDLPYERFGHNALLFSNPATGEAVAYDWGRFDFEQPNFIGRFIRGDMLYSSGREDEGNRLLNFYVNQLGRQVVLQELALTPEQTGSLLAACERSYLPQNRNYRYDYFIANCSTKIRDVLDEALDGQLKAQLEAVPAGTTFRREAERHIAPDWPLWLGFQAGLGKPTDRPIDAWEQCFLPGELQEWLQTVEVSDGDGGTRPLVGNEVVLSEGQFGSVAPQPPRRWWQTGLIGLGLGGGMILLFRLRRPLPARLAAALWFLLAGFGGSFALYVWAFSGHWAGYANQSALLLSPLGLPLAIMVLVPRWHRATAAMAVAYLFVCAAGVVLYFIPGVGQENAAMIALAVPANIGAAWVAGVRPRWERTSPRPEPALA